LRANHRDTNERVQQLSRRQQALIHDAAGSRPSSRAAASANAVPPSFTAQNAPHLAKQFSQWSSEKMVELEQRVAYLDAVVDEMDQWVGKVELHQQQQQQQQSSIKSPKS
jgi:hypothetical protein